MSARRILAPDNEIIRVVTLAQSLGIRVAGLDVGKDYVRTVPPLPEGDSVEQYIGPTHRPKKAGAR